MKMPSVEVELERWSTVACERGEAHSVAWQAWTRRSSRYVYVILGVAIQPSPVLDPTYPLPIYTLQAVKGWKKLKAAQRVTAALKFVPDSDGARGIRVFNTTGHRAPSRLVVSLQAHI